MRSASLTAKRRANRQCIVDGALTKRLQAGQAAGSGVYAAFLAQDGFTGASGIFAGKFGFYELYQARRVRHRAVDPTVLGTAFRGDEVSFKPYACGRPFHAVLDAALALREMPGFGPGQIAGVDLALDARELYGPIRGRPPQAPPWPDRGGPVRPAVPGGHRAPARQGGHHRSGGVLGSGGSWRWLPTSPAVQPAASAAGAK